MKPRLLVADLNAGRRPQQEPYRQLARLGFEVLLLVPRSWQEPFGRAEAELDQDTPGLTLKAVGVAFNGKYHRVLFIGLEREVRDFQPEELWIHAEPENFLAYQALRARDRHCPQARLTLVSWRNVDYPRGAFPYKAAWLHQAIEDRLRGSGTRLLCYNPQAMKIMARRGFEVKPTRMGVNLGYFSPGSKAAARKKLGLPLKGKMAGFAGRFIEEKGVLDLIRAAAGIKGLRLLLVGDGPAKKSWIAQAKAARVPMEIRVLEHGQMADAFRAMDVACLPSRSSPGWKEQFGRVLIEAMACGTPVLGSDSGAIPGVIGKAGIVHAEGDGASLKDGLLRLLKKPLTAQALKRAREFSWASVAKDLARDFTPQRRAPGGSVPVQGVGVFAASQAELMSQLESRFRSRKGSCLLYLNAHLANMAASQPHFREILRQADWVLPDGAGVLLSARINGRAMVERLNLGNLMRPMAWVAAKAGLPLFFWGGEPGVAEAASAVLPGRRAGCAHGYQDAQGEAKVIQRLRASKARLVFLGMGSPKQEGLALRLRRELPGLNVVACGNAMVFVAGLQKRAPAWVQAAQMEWAWRLALEPGRLWRRYLFGNARFLIRAFWERLGGTP